ncbi:MAG TPA: hypothetical protein VFV75_05830 [Candidatus Polarisedimenticolaceae bacterium]|nr:hypothetical protein [Candidatus Polarisedimenticolaceae bacterium]
MLLGDFDEAAETREPVDPLQGYRFVIKGNGGRRLEIRGLVTVDGKSRVIDRAETPYAFGCEAGSVISGYFEALDAGRSLRLQVFDPVYSKRRSALSMHGFDHVRFSWAQPGVGPRCADAGQGACPDTTPSVADFKNKLESMERAAKYQSTFSVGCFPSGEVVTYVWHRVAVPAVEGDRIFKWLAGPGFESCLSEIARTRAGLYESLLDLGPSSDPTQIRSVMERATDVWAERGVYDAVEEVALTNSIGPKTDALLKICADLSQARSASGN